MLDTKVEDVDGAAEADEAEDVAALRDVELYTEPAAAEKDDDATADIEDIVDVMAVVLEVAAAGIYVTVVMFIPPCAAARPATTARIMLRRAIF